MLNECNVKSFLQDKLCNMNHFGFEVAAFSLSKQSKVIIFNLEILAQIAENCLPRYLFKIGK